MQTSPESKTLVAAVVVAFFTTGSFFLDGGRIDFYYKPMIWGWLTLTASSFLPMAEFRFARIIREVWGLQIVMPVGLCHAAMVLVWLQH